MTGSSLASWGGTLFRWRGLTPVPVLLLVLVVSRPSVVSVGVGLLLVVWGEARRMEAVSHIGPRCRTRDSSAGDLVTTGPFAWCRNPLYQANLLILLGFSVSAGRVIPGILAVFVGAVQYTAVVAWEEQRLIALHGEPYRRWCGEIPRWRVVSLVVPLAFGKAAPFTAVLRAERSTLATQGLFLLLLWGRRTMTGGGL